MSHDIFGSRFVGMREPAWHALGTVLQDQVTAAEALEIGGITFEYVTAPLGYSLPDGTFVADSERVAVLRSPTPDDPQYRRLGIVTPGYTFLQNQELAAGLDAISAKTGWTFETVGALNHGSTVFMTLNAGSRSVFGDEYEQYFIVSDGKAVGRSLQVSVAPVRVVCANTLMASEGSATMNVKIGHTARVSSDFSFWTNLVAGLETAREATFVNLETMASRRITTDQAKAIIASAYPLPRKNARAVQADEIAKMQIDDSVKEEALAALKAGTDAYEYWTAKAKANQEAVLTLYERFSDGAELGGSMSPKTLSRLANTPYAALQAVTEFADWSGRESSMASISTSALFGDRRKVKERAWAAALACATSDAEFESPGGAQVLPVSRGVEDLISVA